MKCGLDIPDDMHPLFICEGKCESFVLDMLIENEALVIPVSNIYDKTGRKKKDEIQRKYLNFDFDWPVAIIRLLDSRSEQLVLDAVYRDRFPVIDILTSPELEMLAIIKEGRYHEYTQKYKSSKRKMKPSIYCKSELGLSRIKDEGFLEEYWTFDALVHAIKEYKRLSQHRKGDYYLADLLREDL